MMYVPVTGTVYDWIVPNAPVLVGLNVICSLHPPAMQIFPPVHTTPHAPQFEESLVVSVHVPLHAVLPLAQHVELVHEVPAAQT